MMLELWTNQTMHGSRFKLNADGLKDEPIAESFCTKPFPTHARIDGDNIFFGKLTDSNQERLEHQAEGSIVWQHHDALLQVTLQWTGAQTGLVLCPDGRGSFSPVRARFKKSVNAVRMRSFRHGTELAFGYMPSIGAELDTVSVDWGAENPELAVDRIVDKHLDLIVEGKINQVLDGTMDLATQPLLH